MQFNFEISIYLCLATWVPSLGSCLVSSAGALWLIIPHWIAFEPMVKTALNKHSLNPPFSLPPMLPERSLQLLSVSLTEEAADEYTGHVRFLWSQRIEDLAFKSP